MISLLISSGSRQCRAYQRQNATAPANVKNPVNRRRTRPGTRSACGARTTEFVGAVGPDQIGVEHLLVADRADRQHRNHEQQQDKYDDITPRHRRARRGRCACCSPFGQRIGRQMAATRQVDDQPDHHPDAGRAESPMPSPIPSPSEPQTKRAKNAPPLIPI